MVSYATKLTISSEGLEPFYERLQPFAADGIAKENSEKKEPPPQ